MKILCPTDFSEASTNACHSAAALLSSFESKHIHLVHCINIISRAGMFLKMEEMMRKQATEDLHKLEESLKEIDPEIQITTSVVLDNPKSYIPKLAEREQSDLIITGTEGLSALKEVTIGSVTEFIIRKSSVPVLAVPPQADLKSIDTIAVGIENDINIREKSLVLLQSLTRKKQSKVVGINVRPQGTPESHFKMESLFPDTEAEFRSIEVEDNIPSTLADFVSDNDIDLLVMIHQRKNWLERLFYSSITKAELFSIDFPLLVLPG